MFRHTFSEGFIPPSFKRAAFVPVIKAGDKSKPSNYHLISLSSTICKILENIIRKQVFTYLSDNELFNDTQHGFRSGRSCLSALLDVFDNIMNMLGKDPSVDMVYLDFAKAFDKVDNGILLHKLKDLGITGKLSVCFFHFFSNRSHFVRLLGVVSNDNPVISGVPEGTVLGPLLFLITFSDIRGSPYPTFPYMVFIVFYLLFVVHVFNLFCCSLNRKKSFGFIPTFLNGEKLLLLSLRVPDE